MGGWCCFIKKEEEKEILPKEITDYSDESIMVKEDTKYKKLTDELLLKEIPLSKYVDILMKFDSEKIEEQLLMQYNYYQNETVLLQRINRKQFSNFIELLLKDVNSLPEKKEDTKEKMLLMYDQVIEFGITDLAEEEKRKNGISRYFLLAFGFLYCNARIIDKIIYFFDFFKKQEEKMKFESEVNTFFRILLVLATYGETSCVMKDNKIDFLKYVDNTMENLTDEQKEIKNYAKRFCIKTHINNLQVYMNHLHFCSDFNKIKNDIEKINLKIEKGLDKDTYISLFEKKQIPIFYFSSVYIRDYIKKIFKPQLEEED